MQKVLRSIELMIVVAIIGILAAIAVPNFVSYRNRSRVAATVGTCESIRGAMSAYAADSVSHLFPNSGANWIDITTWDELITALNSNGASLKGSERQGMNLIQYVNWDVDADGDAGDDYYFVFQTQRRSEGNTGAMVEARSNGISRWSGAP